MNAVRAFYPLGKFRVLTVCTAALVILSILAYLLTGGSLLTQRPPSICTLPTPPGWDRERRSGGWHRRRQSAVGGLSGSNQPDRIVKVTMTVERLRLASIPDDSTAQLASEP